VDERKYLGQQQRLCHLCDLMHLKVLQAQVEKISREYKDSCSDLEGERTARRAFQDRIEILECKANDLQQSIVCVSESLNIFAYRNRTMARLLWC
jgi:hypothetical protein